MYPNYKIIQSGGTIRETKLNGIKYYYNIKVHTELEDKSGNTLSAFIYQFDDSSSCVAIFIDKKTKVAQVRSLAKYEDCFRMNPSVKNLSMKDVGKIIVNIVIGFCRRINIRKIELSDNSYFRCPNGVNTLDLMYCHTLTNGTTWYEQFGFVPSSRTDKETAEMNKRIISKAKVRDVDWKKILIDKFESNKDYKSKYGNLIKYKLLPLIKRNGDDNFKKMAKYIMHTDCELFSYIYEKLYADLGMDRYTQRIMVLYL
jgi:hypothetical protein